MSESKPYDQRVREIAEEMAKADCIPGSHLPYDESVIQSIYVPLARIAVKHMAAEAREAWHAGRLAWWSENGELEEGEESKYDSWTNFSKKRGLIPTPERKEAGTK